jgi:hypothetical protein
MKSMPWARNRNLGVSLLAIWLLANGVLALIGPPFPQVGMIMAALSIAAGVMLLLGR